MSDECLTHDVHSGHEDAPSGLTARERIRPPSQFRHAISLDGKSLDSVASSDPIHEVIRQLVRQLVDDVVLPTLSAETRDELFRGLAGRLEKYDTTLSALVCLLQTTPTGAILTKRIESDARSLATQAADIGGPKAFEEVAFCEETYLSAIRIVDRFSGLPEPEDADQDHLQAAKFSFGSTLYTLGGWMIAVIASGKGRATPVGTGGAFELLRLGAMDAYIAARTSLSLRVPPEPECHEPLPFDDEDMALANG